MQTILRITISVLMVTVLARNSYPAFATPNFGATAFWTVVGPDYFAGVDSQPAPQLPDITMSCLAVGIAGPPIQQPGLCGDTFSFGATADHSEHFAASSLPGFRITNTANHTSPRKA